MVKSKLTKSESSTFHKDVLLKRIDERLEECGLTAHRASQFAGLPHYVIREIRRGKKPTFESVAKLAPVLHCSIAYLAGEIDNPTGLGGGKNKRALHFMEEGQRTIERAMATLKGDSDNTGTDG